MMKKLFITTCINILFVGTSVAQFDMGAPEPEKKKQTKKEIVSSTKHQYSEVQKKHQNQIVFSSSAISKNSETPSQFTTTWNMGDPLFFRLYHEQTLLESVYDYHEKQGTEFNEYFYEDFSQQTVVYINGKEMSSYEKSLKKEVRVKDWVTSSGTVFDLNSEKYASGYLATALCRAFQALGNDFKEGSFNVEIKVYAMPSELGGSVERDKSERHALMTSGKLTVVITKEGMNKYAKYLCKDILKYPNEMVNPVLEKQIMDAFASRINVKVIAANIFNEDWAVNRNSLGIVLDRSISAEVAFIDENGDTKITIFTVKQDHDGSNYQNTVKYVMAENYRPYCSFCADYKKTQ